MTRPRPRRSRLVDLTYHVPASVRATLLDLHTLMEDADLLAPSRAIFSPFPRAVSCATSAAGTSPSSSTRWTGPPVPWPGPAEAADYPGRRQVVRLVARRGSAELLLRCRTARSSAKRDRAARCRRRRAGRRSRPPARPAVSPRSPGDRRSWLDLGQLPPSARSCSPESGRACRWRPAVEQVGDLVQGEPEPLRRLDHPQHGDRSRRGKAGGRRGSGSGSASRPRRS